MSNIAHCVSAALFFIGSLVVVVAVVPEPLADDNHKVRHNLVARMELHSLDIRHRILDIRRRIRDIRHRIRDIRHRIRDIRHNLDIHHPMDRRPPS